MKQVGIYTISKLGVVVYIGQSRDIVGRWYHHRSLLRRGKHPNQHLQRSVTKHGLEQFSFCILVLCPEEDLNEAELEACTKQRQLGTRLYNTGVIGGVSGTVATETRQKISEGAKKAHARPEVRVRHVEAAKEVFSRPDIKAKMSAIMGVVQKSPITRAKRSISLKAAFANPEVLQRKSLSAKEANARPEVKAKTKITNGTTEGKARRSKASKEHRNKPEAKIKQAALMKAMRERQRLLKEAAKQEP